MTTPEMDDKAKGDIAEDNPAPAVASREESPDSVERPSFYVGDDEDIITRTEMLREQRLPNNSRYIVVGICAMAKKSKSKPMREILERLERFDYLNIIILTEELILNEPIENWPVVDCLISFHSKGFPLEKAVQYWKMHKPYLLNDLLMQYDIMDRRRVYQILKEEGVDQPRFAVLDRQSGDPSKCQLIESEDQIEVNGEVFPKPFVEKPISAEDHNVYIYFPTSAGGGSQRLFRKIGSRSSVYSPVSRVRKTGSYIYEEFMPTDGTDVKVYTVGPDYAHAEARKSPALDGKVERDKEGKEVRYPVILSAREKLIARKVCMAFKQTVCGFDLLRANGKAYVCDVNGFSFVKNSVKYYDDSAKIIGNSIMRDLAPQLSIPWSITFQPEDIPIVPTTYGTMMELRCVCAIIRHGDRTPKQKMKMEVKHKKFFDLFEKYNGFKAGQLKLKRPKQLQEVLDIARFLLVEIRSRSDPGIEEKKSKLEQLKSVLEMYGYFSGINRKVQLKYQPRGRPKRSSSDDDATPREPSLVLILKWGGELTPAGKIQAEELGKAFRCMYPGGQGDYGGTPGLGLLRLHSTFRHDLKIYASDEGRVQMTAAAFAKGLLALEGELTPILVQMVKSANTNGLLDNDSDGAKYQNTVKEKLKTIMQQDSDFTEDDYRLLAPTNSKSLTDAMQFIKNPRATCDHVYELIQKLTGKIRILKADPKTKDQKLYHGESWELMMRRWSKLEKDFKMKNDQYDISKIPDIYDCIKYDLQHNQKTMQFDQARDLYTCSKALADIVIPQEYGITVEEKMLIAQRICNPLVRKIVTDLSSHVECENEDSTRLDYRYSKGVSSAHRYVRTRLYFTSESHIHSMLNIIRYGGLLDALREEQWQRAMDYVNAVSELNYMTQIVIMLYEDPNKDPLSEERFHVELHFSPGAVGCETDKIYPPTKGYRPKSKEKKEGEEAQQKEEAAKKTPKPIEKKPPRESQTPTSEPKAVRPHDISIKVIEELQLEDVMEEPEKEKKENLDDFKELPDSSGDDDDDNDNDDSPSATSASQPISCQGSTRRKHNSDSSVHGKGSLELTGGSLPGSLTTEAKESLDIKRSTLEDKRSLSCDDNIQSISSSGQKEMNQKYHFENQHRHSFAGLFSPNVIDQLNKGMEGWAKVPAIRPLETLHNSLTMRKVETFFQTICDHNFRTMTPIGSPPREPSTPVNMFSPRPVSGYGSTSSYPTTSGGGTSVSSCNSSAGPSSPTSGSAPDDLLKQLKRLVREGKRQSGGSADTASNSTDRTCSESSEASHVTTPRDTTESMSSQTSSGCSPITAIPGQTAAELGGNFTSVPDSLPDLSSATDLIEVMEGTMLAKNPAVSPSVKSENQSGSGAGPEIASSPGSVGDADKISDVAITKSDSTTMKDSSSSSGDYASCSVSAIDLHLADDGTEILQTLDSVPDLHSSASEGYSSCKTSDINLTFVDPEKSTSRENTNTTLLESSLSDISTNVTSTSEGTGQVLEKTTSSEDDSISGNMSVSGQVLCSPEVCDSSDLQRNACKLESGSDTKVGAGPTSLCSKDTELVNDLQMTLEEGAQQEVETSLKTSEALGVHSSIETDVDTEGTIEKEQVVENIDNLNATDV